MTITELTGKTIKNTEILAVNAWRMNFTDGTSVEISTDQMINTQFGSIPGLIINETKNDAPFHINGSKLMEFINHSISEEEFEVDVLYGWEFTLDEVDYNSEKNETIIHFDIEHGHYVKGHKITFKPDGTFELKLEDPFWGCGGEEELIPIIQKYVESIKQ